MSDPTQEDLSGSEGDQMGSSPPSKCRIQQLTFSKWEVKLPEMVNVTLD